MNKGERTIALLAFLGVSYALAQGWIRQFRDFVMSSVGGNVPAVIDPNQVHAYVTNPQGTTPLPTDTTSYGTIPTHQ